MRLTRITFSALLGLSLSLPALADQQDLELLTDLLNRHKQFSANFQQYTLGDGRAKEELATGRLWIQQPDHFRWETQTPFPQLIVSDGDLVWIYDEDLEQVTKKSAGAQGALTPAAILGGDLSSLERNFEVKLLDASSQNAMFELLPRVGTRVDFQSLRLLFESERLTELLIEDGLGQKSLIMMEGQRYPEGLNPELFEFTPPPGVDLIEDTAG